MTQIASEPRVISGLGDTRPASSDRTATLPLLQLDDRTYERSLDCVHCGLCLPACPTYTQNGLEADSPRGRIYLMKGLADGQIDLTDSVIKHLDLCLDCRACETACPSGVQYHELIEETRTHLATHRKTRLVDKLVNTMFFKVFPYPRRLKLAILPARILQRLGLWRLLTSNVVGRLLPAQIEKMQQMLPRRRAPLWESSLAEHHPASRERCPDGKPKAVVGMFSGCVGSVLFQHINRQTVELLTHLGCEVVVPKQQQCCGAIDHHGGNLTKAQTFARSNINTFVPTPPELESADAAAQHDTPPKIDYIVNNIAGCGAMLKDYTHLLRDDLLYADRAKTFVDRVRDISQLLAELDAPPPTHEVNLKVTYHDACHLAHAQKVTDAPRQVLDRINGLQMTPLTESDMCCGAAGTYNLSQPKMARELAERKINHIQKTGANVCLTGNAGCAMQIQSEADRLGVDLEVIHPVTLLHQAYLG